MSTHTIPTFKSEITFLSLFSLLYLKVLIQVSNLFPIYIDYDFFSLLYIQIISNNMALGLGMTINIICRNIFFKNNFVSVDVVTIKSIIIKSISIKLFHFFSFF